MCWDLAVQSAAILFLRSMKVLNRLHGDGLSTAEGYAQTSVTPVFLAAGEDIKEGTITDRVIRQVDVAPTIAEILGVRKPEQCEGAPVYQILKK